MISIAPNKIKKYLVDDYFYLQELFLILLLLLLIIFEIINKINKNID